MTDAEDQEWASDMTKLKQFLIAGVMAGAVGLGASSAGAVNLFFSFSNDPSLGNVNGTVTGEIFGLDPNGASAATDIVITSYPVGLLFVPQQPTAPNYATPLDVFQIPSVVLNQNNSFTLANGSFVSGQFEVEFQNGDALDINRDGVTNFFSIGSSDTLYVYNTNGVGQGGVTFSAVPEPAAWALMLMGFGGLGAAVRGNRRRDAVATNS